MMIRSILSASANRQEREASREPGNPRSRSVSSRRVYSAPFYSTHSSFAGVPLEEHAPPVLFDVGVDPVETTGIDAAHPEMVARVEAVVAPQEAGMTMAPQQFH